MVGVRRRVLDFRQVHEADKRSSQYCGFKFPTDAGWKIVWIFDHSSCHAAMPDDALVASRMNVNPSGKQSIMWWGDKPQMMCFNLGKLPISERGGKRSRHAWNESGKDEMLGSHPEFKNEKSGLLGEENKHIVYMLPKYHCELNPIERIWAHAKLYSRA